MTADVRGGPVDRPRIPSWRPTRGCAWRTGLRDGPPRMSPTRRRRVLRWCARPRRPTRRHGTPRSPPVPTRPGPWACVRGPGRSWPPAWRSWRSTSCGPAARARRRPRRRHGRRVRPCRPTARPPATSRPGRTGRSCVPARPSAHRWDRSPSARPPRLRPSLHGSEHMFGSQHQMQ